MQTTPLNKIQRLALRVLCYSYSIDPAIHPLDKSAVEDF
jgi:hypothetical protein